MKFIVTIVEVETNETLMGTYSNGNRYECVGKAFIDLVGKKQHDCLDTHKVLDVTEEPE